MCFPEANFRLGPVKVEFQLRLAQFSLVELHYSPRINSVEPLGTSHIESLMSSCTSTELLLFEQLPYSLFISKTGLTQTPLFVISIPFLFVQSTILYPDAD